MLCIHRLREGFKTDRTACVNRIRGLLAEFGLVFGKSAKVLRAVLGDVLEDASHELAGLARLAVQRAVQRAKDQWPELDATGLGPVQRAGRPPYAKCLREATAFRKYLECGIFAHGFARDWCDDCGHDYFVAFSCKGRGVCPSCNTRRMVETAAHLTDRVLPIRLSVASASVGTVGAQTAALLHAARRGGAQHGAAYLPAGHRVTPAPTLPRCGAGGKGRLAPRHAPTGIATLAYWQRTHH